MNTNWYNIKEIKDNPLFQSTVQIQSSGTVSLNSLPNDKILVMTKLKALADNKSNMDKMTISLYKRVENSVGKGENAG